MTKFPIDPRSRATYMAAFAAMLYIAVSGATAATTADWIVATPSLTRAGAERVLQRGLHEAQARKEHVCLVVLDRAGILRSATCMDGATGGAFTVAMAKARSAASFRAPTKAFEEGVENGGVVLLAAAPGLFPIEGGVPIRARDKVVGAVGVSGGASDVDGQIARSAADALASEATP
jgi:glc operon protein GlcG